MRVTEIHMDKLTGPRFGLLAMLAVGIILMAKRLVESYARLRSNDNALDNIILAVEVGAFLALLGFSVAYYFGDRPAFAKAGPWLRASLFAGAVGAFLPLLLALASGWGAGVAMGLHMALPILAASTLVCALLWFFAHLPMATWFLSHWPQASLLALGIPLVLLAQTCLMLVALTVGSLFLRGNDAGPGTAFVSLTWLPSQLVLAFFSLRHAKDALH